MVSLRQRQPVSGQRRKGWRYDGEYRVAVGEAFEICMASFVENKDDLIYAVQNVVRLQAKVWRKRYSPGFMKCQWWSIMIFVRAHALTVRASSCELVACTTSY